MQSTNEQLISILATVELYRDGHYYLDEERLQKAFHPRANIIGYVGGGELMFVNRDEYLSRLSGNKSSAEMGELPDTRVVSVDITDTTAVVKVENLLSGTRYISQLSMIKTKNHWQIVNGLFHAKSQA